MTALLSTAAGAFSAIDAAPPAAADCVYSGGATICSQGEVRGANRPPAPSSTSGTSGTPYYPYPCEDDWLCGDGGVTLVLGGGDGVGPPINIGRPGRPGRG